MTHTEPIQFEADLLQIKGRVILRLPKEASAKLPSRGQVAVHGAIDGRPLTTVLEPDGSMGHWMRADDGSPGDRVKVSLEVTKDWPEPDVPEDIANALGSAPQKVQDKWKDITPMARWEWVRWINETRNPGTRVIRIEKTISKLNGEHRRPCCFNLAACTDPELSRNAKLIEA